MAWRTAESLKQLRAQVNVLAPQRSKASDGTIGDASHQQHTSDHNPWVVDGNVGVVTAIDVTHDPAHGCDAEAIVRKLVGSRDRRIKYLIWKKQIVSSQVKPWEWRPYSGANPHTAHFHLSVLPDKAVYDSTDAWTIV